MNDAFFRLLVFSGTAVELFRSVFLSHTLEVCINSAFLGLFFLFCFSACVRERLARQNIETKDKQSSFQHGNERTARNFAGLFTGVALDSLKSCY